MTEQEKKFTKAESIAILSALLEGKVTEDFTRTILVPKTLVKDIIVILNELSDRDQFAIGFAEWIAEEKYRRLTDNRIVWWGKEWLEEKPISELLDLYKQSLTKTDKK